MSAHVLLNLLNELRKRDKMQVKLNEMRKRDKMQVKPRILSLSQSV